MDSIGNFAEKLISEQLNSIQEGKALPPSRDTSMPVGDPAGRDIRNVDVPESLMSEILGEAYTPPRRPQQKSKEKPQKIIEEVVDDPQLLTEETGAELLSLLHEVKGMLSEMTAAMTSSGNIGINLAGKGSKPKAMKTGEDGYISATQGNSAAKRFLTKRNKRTGLRRSVDDARDPGENAVGVYDDPPSQPRTRKEVLKKSIRRRIAQR